MDSKLQRYEFFHENMDLEEHMYPQDDGRWVKHEDIQTLEAENAELLVNLELIKEWFDDNHTAFHQMIWGEDGKHGQCPICELEDILSNYQKPQRKWRWSDMIADNEKGGE